MEDGGRVREPDIVRQTAAVSLISDLNPDVIVINEALRCKEIHGSKVDYQSLLGLPYLAQELYDDEWGNVIGSRYPILDVMIYQIHEATSKQNRGAIAAQIAFPNGKAWVATFHPHPRRKATLRGYDFEEFLGRLDGPIIFAGDFNAISPEDHTDRDALTAAFERFTPKEECAASVNRFIEAGAILFNVVLPKFKLRDAIPIKGRSATMPTNIVGADRASSMRIDHVLANHHIETLDGSVVLDHRANTASDHYPISFDFRFANLKKAV